MKMKSSKMGAQRQTTTSRANVSYQEKACRPISTAAVNVHDNDGGTKGHMVVKNHLAKDKWPQ